MNAQTGTGMFAVGNITNWLDLLKAHRKTLVLHCNYLGLYVHLLLVVCHGDWCGKSLLIFPIWQPLYDALSFIIARSRRENCFSCSISLVRLDLAACLSFSADMRTYCYVHLVSSIN